MVKWKQSDVERITGIKLPKQPKNKMIPKQDPKGLQFIKNHLKLLGVDYTTELQFHKVRKFRFDVAIHFLKVAIEYEGLNSEKSGHTTLTGYTLDCTKYNLAQLDGWKVLRYTAMNYKDFAKDFKVIDQLNIRELVIDAKNHIIKHKL